MLRMSLLGRYLPESPCRHLVSLPLDRGHSRAMHTEEVHQTHRADPQGAAALKTPLNVDLNDAVEALAKSTRLASILVRSFLPAYRRQGE